MLIRDSSGNKSVTMTMFVIGFIVCNVKLLLSGMTIGGLTLAPFSGTEYGIAIGALGSIYVLRRKGENVTQEKKNE